MLMIKKIFFTLLTLTTLATAMEEEREKPLPDPNLCLIQTLPNEVTAHLMLYLPGNGIIPFSRTCKLYCRFIYSSPPVFNAITQFIRKELNFIEYYLENRNQSGSLCSDPLYLDFFLEAKQTKILKYAKEDPSSSLHTLTFINAKLNLEMMIPNLEKKRRTIESVEREEQEKIQLIIEEELTKLEQLKQKQLIEKTGLSRYLYPTQRQQEEMQLTEEELSESIKKIQSRLKQVIEENRRRLGYLYPLQIPPETMQLIEEQFMKLMNLKQNHKKTPKKIF